MNKPLTSLNVIDVAAPCHADWDAMTGDDQVRHCSQCNLNVYNLSEMTEDEALKLVNEREGRLCVQFYRREDGTLLTKDCPVGLKAIRKAIRQKVTRMWAGTAALAGAIFVTGVFGRVSGDQIPEVERPEIKIDPKLVEVVKGRMCVTPPQSPEVLLSYERLKAVQAPTIKQYLARCLAKEEQASYGMPDPDNDNALPEKVRQAWQTRVADESYAPQPGTKDHDELASFTADLLKKHPDIALQIAGPKLHLEHAIRGQMIVVPEVAPIPR